MYRQKVSLKFPSCGFLVFTVFLSASSALADNAAALKLGKKIFVEEAVPQCAICHTLADAEAMGEVGPDLDELKPTESQVRAAVTSGIGVMPAYGEMLSADQIEAVAKYVSGVVGK